MSQMKCQHCGFVIQVLDELIRDSLFCPSCGEAFPVASSSPKIQEGSTSGLPPTVDVVGPDHDRTRATIRASKDISMP